MRCIFRFIGGFFALISVMFICIHLNFHNTKTVDVGDRMFFLSTIEETNAQHKYHSPNHSPNHSSLKGNDRFPSTASPNVTQYFRKTSTEIHHEQKMWRDDGRCGQMFKLPDGESSICDPNSMKDKVGPCCSRRGWCGNSDRHCKCNGCVDHRAGHFNEMIVRKKGDARNLNKNRYLSKLSSRFLCHEKPLKLLITVLSPAENIKNRNAIRSTWGNSLSIGANDDYRVFFVVGKTRHTTVMSLLRNETEQHGDIISGDFYENYYNEYLKTEMVLEWASKHCDFKYLLNTADDTFINMKNLLQLIHAYKDAIGIYVGEVELLYGHRKPTSFYPTYVTSDTALFSSDVVERLMLHAFRNRYKFPSNLYLGFLALEADVKAIHNKAFMHGGGEKDCLYDDQSISLQFSQSKRGLNCMSESYFEMLVRHSDDPFIEKHYYRISQAVIDSNRRYYKIAKQYKRLHLDSRYVISANLSNLDPTRHVGKLISTFRCHTKPLKAIVMMLSHPANFKRRNAIRSTWGKTRRSHVNNDFRVFFVVGKVRNEEQTSNILRESETYEDIVFGDFEESFYNNSWKIEMMMEYSYKHCQFDYLLKVDDDNFVHMSNVFKLLHRIRNRKKIYLGREIRNPRAMRSSKYGFTYDEYRNRNLAPFVAGGAVVMSRDAVRDVIPYLFLGESKPPMKLEDVYTGFLAMNAGIPVTHSNMFKHSNAGRCKYDRRAISLHFWRRKEQDEVACMQANFKEMLRVDGNDEFIKQHYTSNDSLPAG